MEMACDDGRQGPAWGRRAAGTGHAPRAHRTGLGAWRGCRAAAGTRPAGASSRCHACARRGHTRVCRPRRRRCGRRSSGRGPGGTGTRHGTCTCLGTGLGVARRSGRPGCQASARRGTCRGSTGIRGGGRGPERGTGWARAGRALPPRPCRSRPPRGWHWPERTFWRRRPRAAPERSMTQSLS